MSAEEIKGLKSGDVIARENYRGVVVSGRLHKFSKKVVVIQWIGGGVSVFTHDTSNFHGCRKEKHELV
jgi:hypothetical protein